MSDPVGRPPSIPGPDPPRASVRGGSGQRLRGSWLARHRAQLAALVVGSGVGVAIGLYLHRWWGAGLFTTTSLVSAVAILAVVSVAIGAVVLSAFSTGEPASRRARTSLVLAAALVGGTIAGAALGPGFRPVSTFAGTVSVHVVAPSVVDWRWDAICMTDANASEVSTILAGRWEHGSSAMDLMLGFTTSGTPSFRLGSENDYYDSGRGPTPAQVAVAELAPDRLAGRATFSGLEPSGRGYLPGFEGRAVDGTLTWSCDPTQPRR